MFISEAVGPSYEQLRSAESTETLPVHPDLTTELATAKTHPDDTVAHALATLSGYAYASKAMVADVDTVATIMTRMGLEENHCVAFGQYVDAMFISATSFLVQSRDGRVVLLGYRGTEPVNFVTWLTDFDVYPEIIELNLGDLGGQAASFDVHGGFYRNVRATQDEMVEALRRALKGNSISRDGKPMEHRLEALYITGHSLGGAMAALMAAMLVTEPEYQKEGLTEKLRAVYTFGQPMVGSPEFAEACNTNEFLREKMIRYVHRRDVVPHLPPRASGDFAHFGQEYHYDGKWNHKKTPMRQVILLGNLVLATTELLTRQHRLLRNLPYTYSFNDHGPNHYISALNPEDSPTEFGYDLGVSRP